MSEVENRPRPDTYEGYQAEHDGQLLSFAERMKNAQNVCDLRQAWSECPLVNSIAGYVSEGAHRSFTETAVRTLERMGIDLSSSDERVARLINAMKASVPDEHGSYHHGLHDPEMTGIYRVISGCDPTRETGLRLRELAELVDKPIGIERAAMSFTEADEYTVAHRFPRKASRIVTDPKSPHWGFGVYTDTWPGPSNKNIYLYMPTGLTTRDEILRTESSTDRGWMERNPLYVPRQIDVQSLHLGDRDHGSRQVDTSNGLVSQFVDSIKPTENQGLDWL